LPLVLILSQINRAHTLPSHFFKLHLILTSHLHLGLPCRLLPSGLPTKGMYASLLSPTHLILNYLIIQSTVQLTQYLLNPIYYAMTVHSPLS
jgi:hypothetical protein